MPRFVQQCIRAVEARGTRGASRPPSWTPGQGSLGGRWGGGGGRENGNPRVGIRAGALDPSHEARGQRLPLPQGWTSTACTASVETWPPSRSCAIRWTTVRPGSRP